MTVLELPTPDPRTFDDASRPFVDAVHSRYAIKRLIGRGGMGIVYLARDRRLDRLVAVKTLPLHLARDESVRQRFLRETRTAGAMSHPNIVAVHGADEIDGHVFFVMGFVDGESLASHIRGMGRLDATEVAPILRDVASALGHAHERGTIHRDVKAENILIDRHTGRAMVTDFGIARLAEAAPLTATGQMLGTVYYVSPEQVAGDSVDARSDLYSLGVVGFLALTGTFPFDAELASAVLVAHVNRPAPPVRSINPAVPPVLAAIVDRCLEKNPERRFENADAMERELTAAIAAMNAPGAERPILMSDTEANHVWERAALLQAETGMQSRTPPVAIVRRDAAPRTSGHKIDDIVAAGREAGISTRHLERAIAERTAPVSTQTPAMVARSRWAGIKLDIVETERVEGAVDASRFEHLVNVLRDGTHAVGTATIEGRGLHWEAVRAGEHLYASVVSDGGSTTVRIVEDVRAKAATMIIGGVLGGFVIGGVVAALTVPFINQLLSPTAVFVRGAALFMGLNRHDLPRIAIGMGTAAWLATILASRFAVRRMWESSASRLRLLREALVANVKLEAGSRRK